MIILLCCLLGLRMGEAKTPGALCSLDSPDAPEAWPQLGDEDLDGGHLHDEKDDVTDERDEPEFGDEEPRQGGPEVECAAGNQNFVASKTFKGRKQGFAFKTSVSGTGYHLDLRDDLVCDVAQIVLSVTGFFLPLFCRMRAMSVRGTGGLCLCGISSFTLPLLQGRVIGVLPGPGPKESRDPQGVVKAWRPPHLRLYLRLVICTGSLAYGRWTL